MRYRVTLLGKTKDGKWEMIFQNKLQRTNRYHIVGDSLKQAIVKSKMFELRRMYESAELFEEYWDLFTRVPDE
jgi:hypothetical protein